MSSIPLIDRTKRWGGDEVLAPEASAGRASTGCPFAPRCPYVMDECWETIPPLFRIDPDRAASCFLYKEHPAIKSEEIGVLFRRPEAASVA